MISKYYVTCKHPTSTLTEGHDYDVITFSYDNDIVSVINDLGGKINCQKSRFSGIKIRKEMPKNKISYNGTGKFKNLTKGKTYIILNNEKNYYFLMNDKNIYSRYSVKYFKNISDQPVVEKRKPLNTLKCVIPSENLTYGKRYKIIGSMDGEFVELLDDNNSKIKVLKKRFIK